MLPDNFYKNYKRIFTTRVKPYLVNNLKTIGLPDPFPYEEENIVAQGDLPRPDANDQIPNVYRKGRYIKGNSPYCLYIPNRDLMFKLMRACIKVDHPADLWCFGYEEAFAMKNNGGQGHTTFVT